VELEIPELGEFTAAAGAQGQPQPEPVRGGWLLGVGPVRKRFEQRSQEAQGTGFCVVDVLEDEQDRLRLGRPLERGGKTLSFSAQAECAGLGEVASREGDGRFVALVERGGVDSQRSTHGREGAEGSSVLRAEAEDQGFHTATAERSGRLAHEERLAQARLRDDRGRSRVRGGALGQQSSEGLAPSDAAGIV
jgi:hypothetical protein